MVLKKIKEHQSILRKEIKEKTIGYILAAFGLVAGLAWNEAIKSFIDQFFGARETVSRIRKEFNEEVAIFLVKKDFEKITYYSFSEEIERKKLKFLLNDEDKQCLKLNQLNTWDYPLERQNPNIIKSLELVFSSSCSQYIE